jgi:chaperonin GroEL (HSP60 family)
MLLLQLLKINLGELSRMFLLKVAAIKAPAFGERETHYLEDIAILMGGIRSIIQITFEA